MSKNPDDTRHLSVTAQRALAVSGSVALVLFFVLGFAFHAWAVAWVVFLVPGIVRAWFSVKPPPARQVGYGTSAPVQEEEHEQRPYPY